MAYPLRRVWQAHETYLKIAKAIAGLVWLSSLVLAQLATGQWQITVIVALFWIALLQAWALTQLNQDLKEATAEPEISPKDEARQKNAQDEKRTLTLIEEGKKIVSLVNAATEENRRLSDEIKKRHDEFYDKSQALLREDAGFFQLLKPTKANGAAIGIHMSTSNNLLHEIERLKQRLEYLRDERRSLAKD